MEDRHGCKRGLSRTRGVRETSLHDTSTQPSSEPISQQDTTFVAAESEAQSTPTAGIPMPACPHDEEETDKEQSPHLDGPTSKDMPRPIGVKKAKNQWQRRKQQFNEKQTVGSDSISAALMGVDARAEERNGQNDELKRRRDDILDQRYEEQKHMTEMENAGKEKEHEFTIAVKRAKLVKSLKYLTDQIEEAYIDLEAINQSSTRTPREQFRYKAKRDGVETLEAQHKKMNLLLAITPEKSPNPRPSASGTSTSNLTPRRLHDDDWEADLGKQ